MSIRARLLLFLLPPLVIFVVFLSFFFYLTWQNQIIETFRQTLSTVVVNCAEVIDKDALHWIDKNSNDINVTNSETFRKQQNLLYQIKKRLPIARLYAIRIKPVMKGEKVFPDKEFNADTNPEYDGVDASNAFRRVYIVDGSEPFDSKAGLKRPGDYDFSEWEEHTLYYTKTLKASPLYQSKSSKTFMISAFAPILDKGGHVTALIGADIPMSLMDPELRRALMVMVVGALTTVLFVVAGGYFIASMISKPVKKLTDSALSLAAGEYGKKAVIHGPKEIAELANTLNTMSECLQEHMVRIKEKSLLRERLYGEYECNLLLQHHMFRKVVEDYENPSLALRAVTFPAATTLYGIHLAIADNAEGTATLKLSEATQPGFDAMYELLTHPSPDGPSVTLTITDNYQRLVYKVRGDMPAPVVWSQNLGRLLFPQEDLLLEEGDLVFLYNVGFANLFNDSEAMTHWFSKMLRHFASAGMQACSTILNNETGFLTKKHHIAHDVNILCIRKG